MAIRRTHDYYDDIWREYQRRSPLPRYVFWSVLTHVMVVAGLWLVYTYAPEPDPIKMFNVSLVDADRIGDQAATAPEPAPEPPKEEVEPTPPPPPPPPPKPEPEPKPEPKPEPPKEEPKKEEPKPEPALVKKEEPKPEPPKKEEPKKEEPKKEEPKKPEPPKEEPKPKEPEVDPFADLLPDSPPVEKTPPRQAVAKAPVSQPGLNIDTNALPSELSYWGGSVKRKIERVWRAPEGIPLDPDNRYSVVAFIVTRNGRLRGEPRIVKIGPDARLAQSAIASIKASDPFPPLPDDWRGTEQEVIISFGVD